jgi:hypothetical protein
MYERYYNLDDAQKAALGTAATGAVAIATALAQRPRKELSEVEKRCGKKGRRGKKAAAEWEKCAASQPNTNTNTTQTPPTNDPKPAAMSKNTKIALIAGGSLLVITVITLIVLKRKKK